MPATPAGDLSSYRKFKLGTELSTVTKQVGAAGSLKVIHRRPALIQEIECRLQSPWSASRDESARDVVFGFYNGTLFRITVKYDRYDTEGMTGEDMVAAMSSTYGTATKPPTVAGDKQVWNGDESQVIAQWQDSRYRFDLIRLAYGPTYQLVGVLKQLEAPADAAILKAVRLDEQEAPQREAARLASEQAAAETQRNQARLANKPRFRP